MASITSVDCPLLWTMEIDSSSKTVMISRQGTTSISNPLFQMVQNKQFSFLQDPINVAKGPSRMSCLQDDRAEDDRAEPTAFELRYRSQ